MSTGKTTALPPSKIKVLADHAGPSPSLRPTKALTASPLELCSLSHLSNSLIVSLYTMDVTVETTGALGNIVKRVVRN